MGRHGQRSGAHRERDGGASAGDAAGKGAGADERGNAALAVKIGHRGFRRPRGKLLAVQRLRVFLLQIDELHQGAGFQRSQRRPPFADAGQGRRCHAQRRRFFVFLDVTAFVHGQRLDGQRRITGSPSYLLPERGEVDGEKKFAGLWRRRRRRRRRSEPAFGGITLVARTSASRSQLSSASSASAQLRATSRRLPRMALRSLPFQSVALSATLSLRSTEVSALSSTPGAISSAATSPLAFHIVVVVGAAAEALDGAIGQIDRRRLARLHAAAATEGGGGGGGEDAVPQMRQSRSRSYQLSQRRARRGCFCFSFA